MNSLNVSFNIFLCQSQSNGLEYYSYYQYYNKNITFLSYETGKSETMKKKKLKEKKKTVISDSRAYP